MTTILLAIFASSMSSAGLWAVIARQMERKSGSNELLLGLAHERIVTVGMSYLEQGWVTKDEYDDFVQYLYKPYAKFGGNGLAEKVMTDIKQLPMYRRAPTPMRVEVNHDEPRFAATVANSTDWVPVTPESAT